MLDVSSNENACGIKNFARAQESKNPIAAKMKNEAMRMDPKCGLPLLAKPFTDQTAIGSVAKQAAISVSGR